MVRSDKGFLAIQGMIGAAIVGIMLATLLSVVGNLSDISGDMMAREELDTVMQKVRDAVLTERTCYFAINPIVGAAYQFSGTTLSLPDISIEDQLSSTRLPLITAGQRPQLRNASGALYDGKIRIDSIELAEVSPGNGRSVERLTLLDRTTNATTLRQLNSYITQIVVKSSLRGKAMADQTIALKLYTEQGSNTIASCFTLPTDTQSCVSFDGTLDANGRCQMNDLCNADTIAGLAAETPSRGINCTGRPNCTVRNPGYFWVFQGGEAGTKFSMPICICLEDCT